MIDAFGNCKWCGKHTESTGGCIDCCSNMICIPATYITEDDGTVTCVREPQCIPAKYYKHDC
jgi:hypothetical protein